jgi:hypothetical protein
MIKDKLLPRLEETFSKESFSVGSPPEPIAVFKAKHPGVGELSIWDDGDEVTISIGDITHGHFDSFDSNLTQEEIESEIIENIIDFLKQMFADKYLLFKSQGSGGWQHLDYIEKPFKRQESAKYFVWSGSFDVNSLK